MEQKIIKFCKEFEDYLAKTFNSNMNDIEYYNYCLGQKDTSLNVRSIIKNNEEKEYTDKLKEMQNNLRLKSDETVDNLKKQYCVGGINFINYVLREIER